MLNKLKKLYENYSFMLSVNLVLEKLPNFLIHLEKCSLSKSLCTNLKNWTLILLLKVIRSIVILTSFGKEGFMFIMFCFWFQTYTTWYHGSEMRSESKCWSILVCWGHSCNSVICHHGIGWNFIKKVHSFKKKMCDRMAEWVNPMDSLTEGTENTTVTAHKLS